MRKRVFPLLSGLALSAALLGCPSLPQQYCAVAGECDEQLAVLDPVPGNSDDSVTVCAVNQETTQSIYRANSEEICQKIADARERWMLCVLEEGCDAFDPRENECKDEFNDILELAGDAGDRCEE